MDHPETAIGGANAEFPSTSRAGLASGREAGLEALVAHYWKPVYCHIRRIWARTNEDAKDLTQEFFTRVVLEGSLAERYTPARGRFRAYLKGALNNFMNKEYRDGARVKRGGDAKVQSLGIAEFDVAQLLPDERTLPPDRLFDAAWQRLVLGRAITLLRERLETEGRGDCFEVFRRYDLDPEGPDVSYETLGKALGLPPHGVKHRLLRAREEFRQALRQVVCGTVAGPEDLSAEIRELFGI